MNQYIPLGDLLESSDSGVWGDEDLEAGISVLRSTNFNADGTLDLTKLTFRVLDARDQSRKLLQAGDILLEKSGGGPKQPVGRVCLFLGDAVPHAFGNFIARLRPGKAVLSEYLFYYLWQFHSSGKTSHYQKQTTGIRNLEFKRYLTIPVPVCSIEEQQRIVDQISRAEGIVRLRRQAQQKAAELIPALFADMFGDPVTNPKGWPVSPLSAVSDVISGVAKGRDLAADESVELPYMRVANVKDGRLDLDEVKTLLIKKTEVEKLRIVPGDLLMTEGGDPDKLGRAALWCGEIDLCVHQNHIFKVRSHRDRLVPEYLRSLVGSAYGKAYFLSVAKKTTGIASINKTQLSAFPVLLPPLAAQEKFRRQVEAVEGVGALQDAAAKKAEATFRSLLAKAFTETGPQVHLEMEKALA